jgi:hypothetical protein
MFRRHIVNTLLVSIKYTLVSMALMFISICFVTGNFPPPLIQIWKIAKQMQGQLNLGNSTVQLLQGRQETARLLQQIEEIDKQAFQGSSGYHVAAQGQDDDSAQLNPPAETSEKIKALEYEVAYLKAKLARTEWEMREIKMRAQSATRQ